MQNPKAGAMPYPLETFSSALMALILRVWGSLSLLENSLILMLVPLGPRGEEADPPQGEVLQHPPQLGKIQCCCPSCSKACQAPPFGQNLHPKDFLIQ